MFSIFILVCTGKFVFQEIGGINGKFLSETARLMINQYETKENELLFLGMNGLELKRGKQTKQNNFKILFPQPLL